MSNAKRIASRIASQTDYGEYVDLEKMPDGYLRIILKGKGRERIDELRDTPGRSDEENIMHELLEDHLGNGWAVIRPEQIGALTSAMIISDDFLRDEEGGFAEVGAAYWDSQYQVRSAVDDLLSDGEVTWQGVGAEG